MKELAGYFHKVVRASVRARMLAAMGWGWEGLPERHAVSETLAWWLSVVQAVKRRINA